MREEEIHECEDARAKRTGTYSAWLTKTKSDSAKARWLSSTTSRFFTIDFDSQLFYYSHSEKDKKVSHPIRFKEILGAERMAPPAKATKKGSKNQPSSFMLRTCERAFELHTTSNVDAAQWVYALNAARDMGMSAGAVPQPVQPTQQPAVNLDLPRHERMAPPRTEAAPAAPPAVKEEARPEPPAVSEAAAPKAPAVEEPKQEQPAVVSQPQPPAPAKQ
eukprot:CAMPEP_0195064898 /NCGR_PEP_ID=MMETSP0448-20130528/10731_1 /TAXON_ID=66468 /ORGANISM="Heterocapsa triquestra, Strain CCMP 448" /LENGTH=218 /DNA_ID=CAMNT_0040095943 /DNA_START=78 /DNA_END=731 /DNA_ORIENTATION=+